MPKIGQIQTAKKGNSALVLFCFTQIISRSSEMGRVEKSLELEKLKLENPKIGKPLD